MNVDMKVSKNIPVEIDYDQFKWLSKGDRLKIAAKTNMSASMVRKTIKRQTFNIDILTTAMKMVVDKKRELLTYQNESQQLSNKIHIKAA